MTGGTRRAAARLATCACVAGVMVVVAAQPWQLLAQAPVPANVKFAAIKESDMREFLGYLASDALQGRQIYTEGYGLAASYIAENLRAMGVKPMGDNGTYFQTVKNVGYKVTRNSTVTVEVNGETKTFKQGDHVSLPINSGGKQTLTFNTVDFAGYGMVALNAATPYNDFAGRDVKGKLVVYLPGTPQILTAGGRGGRGGGNRTNYIIQTMGAAAVGAFAPAPAPPCRSGPVRPSSRGRARQASAVR